MMLITTGNPVLQICGSQKQSDVHVSIRRGIFKATFRSLLNHKLYIFWKGQISVWLRKGEIKRVTSENILGRLSYTAVILNIRNCYQMRVSRQTKVLTVLPQGKCPPYSLGKQIRESEIRSRCFGEEMYISYLFRVSNPRFIGHPAQSLVTLPTAISRCLYQC